MDKIAENINTILKIVEPFKALGHSLASINIAKGTDAKTVSEILDYADISITLQANPHTSNKAKTKSINKFNNNMLTENYIKRKNNGRKYL